MGKASSSKKLARASQAAGRPGPKRNAAWPLAAGAIVVVGILLVVTSVGGSESTALRVGDHWHAAFGIYDCGAYLPPLNDAKPDTSGVHAHGEGLMHIHPLRPRSAGKGATVAAFLDTTGSTVSDDSFDAGSVKRTNGETCGGSPGKVQLLVWDTPSAPEPTIRTKDIGAFAPKDGSVVALAFTAAGADVPQPPSTANLADPTATEEGREPAVGGNQAPSSLAPGGTDATTATAPTTTIPARDNPTVSTP